MARKEFTYRGRTVQELQEMSMDEFAHLLPSSERRKVSRGFTHDEKSLLKKLAKRDKVKTKSRAMIVLPSMVGKTIMVHNGKEYVAVTIQAEMIGRRLGAYALTRKPTKHSSAGVMATKKEKK
ncbi:30S ribosomal protein S19 [Candidatus Woesearchaeota archaeon]|nr:MAG: 30S ribosomal protein S19 [Candidatus Woesearchaeota archaeon]